MIKRKNAVLLEATRTLYEAMFRFDNRLAGVFGMHMTDLRCANALESGPLTPGQIGERLALTSGSVTSMLNRMEALGYIIRTTDPDDSRRSRVELTRRFYAQAEREYGLLGQAIMKRFESLASGDLQHIAAAIDQLALSFDDTKESV